MSVKNNDEPRRRIFLVDDHPVTREGLAQLINYHAGLRVCGQAATIVAALAGIHTSQPDLVIVDISLGDGNGLELTKHIVAKSPTLPVLIMSMYPELLYGERAWRAGAGGYVTKQAPTHEVLAAIRQVLRGELYFSEKIRKRLIHEQLHSGD
ncbi:MAG: response regulator transcription factor [Opitutaceae bacterium]|nr:response regulator transcription factor [Opitutaceae bacterium]